MSLDAAIAPKWNAWSSNGFDRAARPFDPVMLEVLPDGVKVVAVRVEPRETRRVVVAHLPGPLEGPVFRVANALIAAALT